MYKSVKKNCDVHIYIQAQAQAQAHKAHKYLCTVIPIHPPQATPTLSLSAMLVCLLRIASLSTNDTTA